MQRWRKVWNSGGKKVSQGDLNNEDKFERFSKSTPFLSWSKTQSKFISFVRECVHGLQICKYVYNISQYIINAVSAPL